jgi:hypothetical protein
MFRSQAQGDLSIFGNDPGAVIAVKVVGIFVIMVVMTLLTIWAERRVVGRMQMRIGPNRVGPFGSIAVFDGRNQVSAKGRNHSKGCALSCLCNCTSDCSNHSIPYVRSDSAGTSGFDLSEQ